METTFVAARRSLPPVPRPAADRAAGRDLPSGMPPLPVREASDRIDRDETHPEVPHPEEADPQEARPAEAHPEQVLRDDGQQFVARLRGAASDFALAAGAQTAVVREAVPPARHRRSRCRLVLRYPGGEEVDLTFLGPVERPGAGTPVDFGASIREWLGNDQCREPAWLAPDDAAADGVAVDVTAWLAAR